MSFAASLALALAPLVLGAEQDTGALVREGRQLLEQGRAADAEEVFRRALADAPDAVDPQIWLYRSWMNQGRINDALDAIDALKEKGTAADDLDYLYGMAWFLAAEAKLASGSRGGEFDRNIADATLHLSRAVDADAPRYKDALYPLAKVAWIGGRLDLARKSARDAAQVAPNDARAHHLHGRVSFSQYRVLSAEPGGEARAAERARDARASLGAAIALLAEPTDSDTKALLAESHLQRARLFQALGDAASAEEFASALEWDPGRIDYNELADTFAPEPLAALLERGAKAFETREGKGEATGAAHWWRGYALYRADRRQQSERAFLAALATGAPEIDSAWYYVARLRYADRNFDGAIDALRRSWELDPAVLLKTLESDREFNGPMVHFLASRAAEGARVIDATILFELAAEIAGTPESWRQLGVYLRTEGERLRAAGDLDRSARTHLTALQSFERAVSYETGEPIFFLEAGQQLHLYLDAQPERARYHYERARHEAGRRMTAPDLSVARRGELERIRRAATDGLRKLAE